MVEIRIGDNLEEYPPTVIEILRSLYFSEDPLTSVELRDQLAKCGFTLDDRTIRYHLSNLEKDGLVTRERDPQDKRKMCILLTEKARALEPGLMEIASDTNRMMLQDLSLAEELLLRVLLKRMRGRLRENMAEQLAAIAEVSELSLDADQQPHGMTERSTGLSSKGAKRSKVAAKRVSS